jgi:hypothetical protein
VAAAKREATLSNSIETILEKGSTSDGVFAFYKIVDCPGRLTFWACASSWTLDAMDFTMFPPAIISCIPATFLRVLQESILAHFDKLAA